MPLFFFFCWQREICPLIALLIILATCGTLLHTHTTTLQDDAAAIHQLRRFGRIVHLHCLNYGLLLQGTSSGQWRRASPRSAPEGERCSVRLGQAAHFAAGCEGREAYVEFWGSGVLVRGDSAAQVLNGSTGADEYDLWSCEGEEWTGQIHGGLFGFASATDARFGSLSWSFSGGILLRIGLTRLQLGWTWDLGRDSCVCDAL